MTSTKSRFNLFCATAAPLFGLLALGFAVEARAGIITPAGLHSGDQFRIVFVTAGSHDAASTDISVYDAFVTSQATGLTTYAADPTQTVLWQVIGSTATVSAISRIPLSSPAMFLPNGTMVANSGADMWDGTIDTYIDMTAQGVTLGHTSTNYVWSGTSPDGTATTGSQLGSSGPNNGNFHEFADTYWISGDRSHANTANQQFYAVSSVLTVPGVPEPGAITLALMGLAGLVALRKQLRRA
jgi:hypothetical protein